MAEVIQLRDYQTDIVDRTRLSLRRHRRVLIQASTGAGKTAIGAYMTKAAKARGWSVAFNVHRTELAQSTSKTFRRYGIGHGFIASDKPITDDLVNVCMIETLKNRLATTPEPRIAFWDECHHLGAAGWQAIMHAWPNAVHIGLSATPWRLDGSGLDDQFEDMVCGPSTAWLIEHGHLAQFEIYAPFVPNMKGVGKDKEGEFTKRGASACMDIPKRTGDIIKHWREAAFGLRTIAFAVNIVDSMTIVRDFNAAGIPAAHLDGKTPKGQRKKIIDAFARGDILVLSNVGLFDEGFDLASIAETDVTIDCLIDAAPTLSLSKVLQRWGRVLRPKPYPAIILDHAGNSMRHGFPDDEREWTLQGREKTGKGGVTGPPPPVTCTGCYRQYRRPLPLKCPRCGKLFQAEQLAVKASDGKLHKMTAEDKAAATRARKLEEHLAKTLDELVALGQARGFKNPMVWAMKKWSKSKARQRHHKIHG